MWKTWVYDIPDHLDRLGILGRLEKREAWKRFQVRQYEKQYGKPEV